jgi:spermidine dehydrogenase
VNDERNLGLDAAITRRDFLGSTLIGSGAALLAAQAPGAAQAAVPFPSPHGPDWSGPGGIGDYAKAHGNTHEVVNAAHAMRDGAFAERLKHARDTGETFDLVCVGGGFSGIGAAYTFHKHTGGTGRCLILDNHDLFGGEAKQNEFEVDGYHLWGPQGSNGQLVPTWVTKKLGYYHPVWAELGMPEEFEWQNATGLERDLLIAKDVYSPMLHTWEAADCGHYYGNGRWVVNPWNNGFKDAPIPERLKFDYLLMDSYRMPPRRPDWDRWLDGMTYLDFLTKVVGVSPEYADLPNPLGAVVGTGLGADAISAYSAFNFVLPGPVAYWRYLSENIDPTDPLHLASFPGGNTGILRKFVKAIAPHAIAGGDTLSDILFGAIQWHTLDRPENAVRFRLRSTVVAVRNVGRGDDGRAVEVTFLRDGALHKVRAKAVVMACNQAVNKKIVQDLPGDVHAAMDSFLHAPVLTVNVAVRHWRFFEKLGCTAARWFEGFGWFTCLRRQLIIDGREPMPLDPRKPTVLTLYVPFLQHAGLPVAAQATAARYELLNRSYRDFEQLIRAQFQTLFGEYGFDARRDIAGIVLNRWGHAYVIQPPGFYFGTGGAPAPRERIRSAPVGRIAFGHSELTGTQVWETAYGEGERAAQQAMKAAALA